MFLGCQINEYTRLLCTQEYVLQIAMDELEFNRKEKKLDEMIGQGSAY
jgi:hypothetical protein